ncbi:nitrilase-related carbon-nitrogen hydrolase [Ancylobacter sp. WKF20]|uniref:nitrilase-related carbon-nitrogen hydrolase n=1 Tax=Ancylobacter sp. WKF20 TaxID=3039801 RepID=UPI0024344518|nr:nitrilase-related carbon-nitrogen hydrolase [Ancylobacter sp. WKF20]WGD32184.1 nitrilase-related carbon-nitrogen hydrolase [Ancylobacter sp. WKF20]
MTLPLKVATVQFEPTLFEKERNITRLLDLVAEAADAGAKLIVTPEMGTTGYCWFDRAEVAPFIETIPGPTTERFAALAQQQDCYIVIGMPEVDAATGLYYNSAVLIGPEGVVGTHRKTHPYISEPKWSAPGDLGHQVFDTPIGRIALLICMDIHFVETARLVALGGADIICHISNWLAERTPAPYWISRAVENGCYLIESNRWGLERGVQFSGGSCVIEPDGTLAAVIDGGDGVALAEIDLERARARQMFGEPVFEQRRPELYMELPTSTYAWNPLDFFGLYGHRPLPPGRQSRVAVAQFTPSADIAANLAQIEALASEARRSEGAEMVVFPERALTGFDLPNAQPVNGPATARLQTLASRLGIYLVVGLAEEAGGQLYNSALLLGPEGLIGTHRKLHLDAADGNWASAGDDWSVLDTQIGRIGLLIGHDASFPEAGRVLALRGCDLIACPAAIRGPFTGAHAGSKVAQSYPIPTGADPHHWHHFRARAGENNVFFAFANALDPARGYEGKSGVFGPDTFEFPRREAIIAEGTGVAVATVDTTNLDSRYPTNVVRRKDLVLMRQPHHYQPLISTR